MAPTEQIAEIAQRALCPSGYYYDRGYCYRNSAWYGWGRWLFTGIIIVFFIIVLSAFCCISSRRRRRRGMAPRYGTGWMAPQGKFGGNNNPQAYAPPPPQYSQNAQQYPTNDQYGPSNGYYGAGHNEGVQQPPNTYYPRGGEQVYAPPAGPPPGK